MKRKFLSLLTALALCLLLAPAALAAGEAEPNNSYTAATPIRVNEAVSGSFTPSGGNGDADWYRFTLDKPGRVEFSFDASYNLYFSAQLQGINEKGALQEIYYNNFNGLPYSVSDTISHEALPIFLDQGTYYLNLYASSSYEGAYTFRADYTAMNAGSLEYEPNSDYRKSTPIDLNTTVSGSFTPLHGDGDADWYRFTMPAAGRLDLSFEVPSNISLRFQLSGTNEKGALEQICREDFPVTSYSVTGTASHTAEAVYLNAGIYYLQLYATSNYEGAYTFQAASDAAPKPDLPSSWAAAEVSAAIEAGLVPESLQKNYTGTVTRSQVAGLFIRLLEESAGQDIDAILAHRGVSINQSAFTDTTDKNVLAANALGIINGVGGSRFDPSGTFTRAQIAAILNRIAGVMGVETAGYTHSFTDVSGHWVSAELGWPVHAGILNGVGSGRFDPDGALTTEQAILMAYRALKALD